MSRVTSALRLAPLFCLALLACRARPQVTRPGPVAVVGALHAVRCVAVSPNARLFAVECDQEVIVYETIGGRERFRSPHSALMGDSAFDSEGKRLLVAREGKPVVVATDTGKIVSRLALASFRISDKHGLKIRAPDAFCAAFAPDGKTIALSIGTLYHMFLDLYDAASGKLVRSMLNDVDGVALQIVFSLDGSMVIDNQGLDTYFLETATGKEVQHLDGEIRRVWFLPASRNGQFCYLLRGAVYTGSTRLRPTANLPSHQIFPASAQANWKMVNAGSSGLIAILEGEEVVLRNGDGKEMVRLDGLHRDTVKCIAFSADGATAIIGRSNGLAEVWHP